MSMKTIDHSWEKNGAEIYLMKTWAFQNLLNATWTPKDAVIAYHSIC
jgi:hypothetical protein